LTNLAATLDFAALLLSLGVFLLFLLHYLEKPARGQLYLATAFLLLSGSFAFQLAQEFSPSFILLPFFREFLYAVGLIFFTTVVVEVLFPYRHLGLYYLLITLGLTSTFSLIALATLDLNLTSYRQHWSEVVWSLVQIIILSFLTFFLLQTALKTKRKGAMVFATVFTIWLIERAIESVEFHLLSKPIEPNFLIEKNLHLAALILMFTYAALSLAKLVREKR
jgi:hypothetical protein